MKRHLRAIFLSIGLLLCGAAAGVAFKAGVCRERADTVAKDSPQRPAADFPIMSFAGMDYWFYRVPEPVLQAITATQQSPPNPEGLNLISARGSCRAFGARVYTTEGLVYWEESHVLKGELLYRDLSGRLADYSQYLALFDASSMALAVRWAEIETLVKADGLIDESKLTEEQRKYILAHRERFKKFNERLKKDK